MARKHNNFVLGWNMQIELLSYMEKVSEFNIELEKQSRTCNGPSDVFLSQYPLLTNHHQVMEAMHECQKGEEADHSIHQLGTLKHYFFLDLV